jgi:hypothetical protein
MKGETVCLSPVHSDSVARKPGPVSAVHAGITVARHGSHAYQRLAHSSPSGDVAWSNGDITKSAQEMNAGLAV